MGVSVVVEALRTPVTRRGGALAGVPAWGLASPVLAELARRAPAGTAVDDVLLASARPAAGNLARIAALDAWRGLDGDAPPGITVDRQCAGGLETVRLAAALVDSGAARVVLAGGVDSASAADGDAGVRTGPSPQASFAPPGLPDPGMGEAADALARVLGIGRERQDRYAVRSHACALRARTEGTPAAETVPVDPGPMETGPVETGPVDRVPVRVTAAPHVVEDDRPRSLTLTTAGRLRPVFRPAADGGTVTPGNACGIADGAAAVLVVADDVRAAHRLPGLRIVATATTAGDPGLPGLAAVRAARAVLARAGRKPGDLEVLEVTEAFAAQVLALTDGLGIDPWARTGPAVCPDGGSLALGHPWGASGTLLLVRLFSRLIRCGPATPGRLGLAVCPAAGGQGVAVLVEVVR